MTDAALAKYVEVVQEMGRQTALSINRMIAEKLRDAVPMSLASKEATMDSTANERPTYAPGQQWRDKKGFWKTITLSRLTDDARGWYTKEHDTARFSLGYLNERFEFVGNADGIFTPDGTTVTVSLLPSTAKCGNKHSGYGLACTKDKHEDGECEHGPSGARWTPLRITKLQPATTIVGLYGQGGTCGWQEAERLRGGGMAITTLCRQPRSSATTPYCEEHVAMAMRELDAAAAAKKGPPFRPAAQSHNLGGGMGVWSLREVK